MAERLLVVGDVAIEMLMKLRHMPAPGETLQEEGYLFLPGGPAGNAALAATYFGANAYLCSRVGKDGNAARLKNFFTANGINIDAVMSEPAAQTGMLVGFTEESYGEARTVCYRGASAKLSAGDIDSALREEPDGVFLSPEVNGYIAGHAVASCEALKIPVFLDASNEGTLRALSTKGARVKGLYTTDKVAESFTDMSTRDVGSALKCCLTLGQRIGADFYVLRMKNKGLFLYDGKTYNIVMASDSMEKTPKIGFADVESAVLFTEYLLHGNPYNAAGVAVIADILARDNVGFRIPSREQVAAYAKKYGLAFGI